MIKKSIVAISLALLVLLSGSAFGQGVINGGILGGGGYRVAANSGPVAVAPYATVDTSGSKNWGLTIEGARWFLTRHNQYRIRQAGTIVRARVPIGYIHVDFTELYVTVWRKNSGGTYDRVGKSANLRSQVETADAVATLTISPGIAVQEGDYVGYGVVNASTDPSYQFFSVAVTTGTTHYATVEPGETGYAWESQSSAGVAVRIGIDVEIAPHFVIIGDSIAAGHPAHYPHTENSFTQDFDSTIAYNLRPGWTYQNMGVGSQTTTQIAARIAGATASLPRFVILEGGVNDIAGGSISKETFLGNWTTMIDAVIAADAVPVCLLILPWSDGTTEQMQTRDEWNADLSTLIATKATAIEVDCSEEVGLFRVGGDVGNLWNIQAAYNADGVHYTAAGHAAIAAAIWTALLANR